MTQTTSIHGHDILDLVHDHEQTRPLTRALLEQQAALRFGPAARFHTCATDQMTLAELLDFLFARGKLIERDGRLFTDLSKVCDHDGDASAAGETDADARR